MPSSFEVGISNRALQRLGAKRIASLTDDSVNARACNTCILPLHQALLCMYRWNFSIVRVQLPADATAPIFTRTNSFTLPGDALMPLPPDPEDELSDRDWIIEGRKIITNDGAPLNLRYVQNITDFSLCPPLYKEALSAYMAQEMCEQLTQSNTKYQTMAAWFDECIAQAKKSNTIEIVASVFPDDTWITRRL